MENEVNNMEGLTDIKHAQNLTKLRIIKNVLVLSFSFLLICTSVDGLQMLQSTLNRNGGVGVVSIAIQFAFGSITALFFMKYFILKFGPKMTVTFCILAHIPSTVANFYPYWICMVPSYTIVGIAGTLLWGSNSAYLNEISIRYANDFKTIPHSPESESADEGINHPSSNISVEKELPKINFDDGIESVNNLYHLQSEDHLKASVLITSMALSSPEVHDYATEKCSCDKNLAKPSKSEEMSTIFHLANATIHTITSYENSQCPPSSLVSKQANLIASIKSNNLRYHIQHVVESTTARFFGIHSMFYQSGHIWSNIVSFYVLQQGVSNDTYIHDSSCMCGAEFCNIDNECFENNLKEPPDEVKFLLISIFLALNILAVLLTAVFLDPLGQRKIDVNYSREFALATFQQLKRPLQLLIAPLSVYMGMSQGFFYADFPKAFVGCAWGMHHVGLVTITFGITCSVTSTLSGWLVKHLGRRTIFLIAAAINIVVNIIMLLWNPDATKPLLFFIVAGMWGALMGSFWSQLKAFHGVLFKNNEEAAFGCYELSHCLGACISFACSNYICVYVKIYMLLVVSTIGMIGYVIAEQIRGQNKLN